MVREIEADPTFELFVTLFGAVEVLATLASRIAALRRYAIPLLAD